MALPVRPYSARGRLQHPDAEGLGAGPGQFRGFSTFSRFEARDPLRQGEDGGYYAMSRPEGTSMRTLDFSKLNEDSHNWQRADTFQTSWGNGGEARKADGHQGPGLPHLLQTRAQGNEHYGLQDMASMAGCPTRTPTSSLDDGRKGPGELAGLRSELQQLRVDLRSAIATGQMEHERCHSLASTLNQTILQLQRDAKATAELLRQSIRPGDSAVIQEPLAQQKGGFLEEEVALYTPGAMQVLTKLESEMQQLRSDVNTVGKTMAGTKEAELARPMQVLTELGAEVQQLRAEVHDVSTTVADVRHTVAEVGHSMADTKDSVHRAINAAVQQCVADLRQDVRDQTEDLCRQMVMNEEARGRAGQEPEALAELMGEVHRALTKDEMGENDQKELQEMKSTMEKLHQQLLTDVKSCSKEGVQAICGAVERMQEKQNEWERVMAQSATPSQSRPTTAQSCHRAQSFNRAGSFGSQSYANPSGRRQSFPGAGSFHGVDPGGRRQSFPRAGSFHSAGSFHGAQSLPGAVMEPLAPPQGGFLAEELGALEVGEVLAELGAEVQQLRVEVNHVGNTVEESKESVHHAINTVRAQTEGLCRQMAKEEARVPDAAPSKDESDVKELQDMKSTVELLHAQLLAEMKSRSNEELRAIQDAVERIQEVHTMTRSLEPRQQVCENLGGLRAPIEKAGPPIEESSSLELMDVNKELRDMRSTVELLHEQLLTELKSRSNEELKALHDAVECIQEKQQAVNTPLQQVCENMNGLCAPIEKVSTRLELMDVNKDDLMRKVDGLCVDWSPDLKVKVEDLCASWGQVSTQLMKYQAPPGEVSELRHGRFSCGRHLQQYLWVPQGFDLRSKEVLEAALRQWRLPRPRLLLRFLGGSADLVTLELVQSISPELPSNQALLQQLRQLWEAQHGSSFDEALTLLQNQGEPGQWEIPLRGANQQISADLTDMLKSILKTVAASNCWILVHGAPCGALALLESAGPEMVVLVVDSPYHPKYSEVDSCRGSPEDWTLDKEREVQSALEEGQAMVATLRNSSKPLGISCETVQLGTDFWSASKRWGWWPFRSGTHYIFTEDPSYGEVNLDLLAPQGLLVVGGELDTTKQLVSGLKAGAPSIVLGSSGGAAQSFAAVHACAFPSHQHAMLRGDFSRCEGKPKMESLFRQVRPKAQCREEELSELAVLYQRKPRKICRSTVVLDPLDSEQRNRHNDVALCIANSSFLPSSEEAEKADMDLVTLAWKFHAQLQKIAFKERMISDGLAWLLAFFLLAAHTATWIIEASFQDAVNKAIEEALMKYMAETGSSAPLPFLRSLPEFAQWLVDMENYMPILLPSTMGFCFVLLALSLRPARVSPGAQLEAEIARFCVRSGDYSLASEESGESKASREISSRGLFDERVRAFTKGLQVTSLPSPKLERIAPQAHQDADGSVNISLDEYVSWRLQPSLEQAEAQVLTLRRIVRLWEVLLLLLLASAVFMGVFRMPFTASMLLALVLNLLFLQRHYRFLPRYSAAKTAAQELKESWQRWSALDVLDRSEVTKARLVDSTENARLKISSELRGI